MPQKAARRVHGKKVMARYLPAKAWSELSAVEKKSTNVKKAEGSKKGRQFVANTKKAAGARQQAAIAVHQKAAVKKKKAKVPAKKKAKKKI